MWMILKGSVMGLSLVFFLASEVNNNIDYFFISLLMFFVFNLIFTVEKIQKRISYFLFLITFFVFLLGNYTILFFREEYWFGSFEKETIQHTILYLFISLIFINIGYIFGKIKLRKGKYLKKYKNPMKTDKYEKIRRTSKYVYFSTLPVAIYLVISKIISFSLNGYLYRYLTGNQSFIIFEKLEVINTVSFFLFLSTLPSKKEAKYLIASYLVINVLTIFAGSRGTAVTAVLTVIFYLIFRNRININKGEGEKWISKGKVIFFLTLTPFILMFISAWGYLRIDQSIENMNSLDLITDFFESQGSSVNVINYSQILNLPDSNLSYTFGPVLFFLKYNIFSKIIFDWPMYFPQTESYALFGNHFPSTISYLVIPENYRVGLGLGSSYIAEVVVDFKIWGLMAYNLLLGIVLRKYEEMDALKPWVLAVLLMIFNSLLTLPRDVALNWFEDVINLTTLGTFLVLYGLSRIDFKLKSSNERKVYE